MPGLIASTSRLAGEPPVVDVRGELDLHTSPQLGRELASAFRDGADSVTVNLTGCEFLDSSTLTVLLRAQQELGRVSLVIADPQILKVFEITGFDRFFPIHASLDEAASEPSCV